MKQERSEDVTVALMLVAFLVPTWMIERKKVCVVPLLLNNVFFVFLFLVRLFFFL